MLWVLISIGLNEAILMNTHYSFMQKYGKFWLTKNLVKSIITRRKKIQLFVTLKFNTMQSNDGDDDLAFYIPFNII